MTTTEQKLTLARQALEDIKNPIEAMRRAVPEGYRFEGGMALHMANDPEWYKRCAERALEAIATESAPAAGAASIDTPEFASVLRKYYDSVQGRGFPTAVAELIAHINAWGAQQRMHAETLAEAIAGDCDKWRERAEAAEAALAELSTKSTHSGDVSKSPLEIDTMAQRAAGGVDERVEHDDWKPTPTHINNLPHPVRDYIHGLVANADPAGMVAENVLLRDQTKMLDAMIGRLKTELAASRSAALEDAANAVASTNTLGMTAPAGISKCCAAIRALLAAAPAAPVGDGDERAKALEEAAKICEAQNDTDWPTPLGCAKAIRAALTQQKG